MHGGRPRSLRGCHALAPTPQGQPYQASPQRLFMSSGSGRGSPPTPQPYIWITRSSPSLEKNTTFAPPSSKIFDANPTHISLLFAGRAALAKYWRQVCRRLRGSKAVCSPGKKPGQARSQYVISISSPSTPMALTTTTTQLLNERRCKKKKK